MKHIVVGSVAIILLTASSPGRAQDPRATVGDPQAYVAEIEAERRTAQEELRSDHWSPLALIAMVRLDAGILSIGSGASDGLVLDGPGVVSRHAEVVPERIGGQMRYRILARAGELFEEGGNDDVVTDLLLERGGPRLRLGRFVVYYDEIVTLGPVIRVLDFESPGYTLFDGLDYFPVDPRYRVEATLHPHPEPEAIQIVDTMGFLSPAWVYGEAELILLGQPLRLKMVLFTPDPEPGTRFYLIFRDETNGEETYGACRYLLPEFVPAGKIVLDFNRAVNPSCAYNSGFACPLPPPGNRIPFAVRAGIKDYAHGPAH